MSQIAGDLDSLVTAFSSRPLAAGAYKYLWIAALTQKGREGGRVVNVSVVIVTVVNAEGRCEIAGVDVVAGETTDTPPAAPHYGTELINAGISPPALMALMGHVTPEMTLRYATLASGPAPRLRPGHRQTPTPHTCRPRRATGRPRTRRLAAQGIPQNPTRRRLLLPAPDP